MSSRPGRVFVSLFLVFMLAEAGFAADSKSEFALLVRGDPGQERKFSLDEIAKLPRFSVRAKDEKGKESVWEGTSLYQVLLASGVKFGEALRGQRMAEYFLVEAMDGYRVAFTLPEIDPEFADLRFLLADRRDGAALGEFEGPLRVIVPHEKRHARWVRRVVSLSIRR